MSDTPSPVAPPIRGKLYSIPASQPFIETLARGILGQAKDKKSVSDISSDISLDISSNISFSEWLVFLPTRRACVELRQTLLRLSAQSHDNKKVHAVLLPRIKSLGDTGGEEANEEEADQEEADAEETEREEAYEEETDEDETERGSVSALQRHLLLAQLTEKWLDTNDNAVRTLSSPAAVSLARALARLQQDFAREEANPKETLSADMVPANCAAHWYEAFDFLRIIVDKWPQVLKTQRLQDPDIELVRTLSRHAKNIRTRTAPVIVAGSTGSVKATARLMRATLALPEGQVVLAGCPAPLDAASRRALFEDGAQPTHPLHPFRTLFSAWDMSPEEIANLLQCYSASSSSCQNQQQAHRAALLARAFSKRPTPLKNLEQQSSTGLTLLPCAEAQEEANLIALILREALEEKGQRAALITRDRTLARRVRSALKGRWNLEIEDTAQQPLSESRAAQLFLLTIKALAPEEIEQIKPEEATAPLDIPLDIIALKALFARGGGSLALEWQGFEANILRKADRNDPTKTQRTAASWNALSALVATSQQAKKEQTTPLLQQALATLAPLAELLSGATTPRSSFLPPSSCSRLALLRCHRLCAENFTALCNDDDDSTASDLHPLYRLKGGVELKRFCDTLENHWNENSQENNQENNEENKQAEEVQNYLPTLEALLAAETRRGEYATHPRLAILGALEARLLSFDLLVLGGMTEGSWPAEPDKSPFLPESLRAKVGLKPLEHNIGLSALDFVNFASTPNRVIISYAARHNGQPQQPSRFVQRLQACHPYNNPCRNPAFEAELRAWLALLLHGEQEDLPKEEKQEEEKKTTSAITVQAHLQPPSPQAPQSARPQRLSLTSLTTLEEDPYSIYARQVLRLSPLEGLLTLDEPALYGSCLHACFEEILQTFATTYTRDENPPATENLESIIARQLARFAPSRFAQAFWSEPLLRSAQQLLRSVRALRPQRLWCEVKGEYRIALEEGRSITLSARADLVLEAEDGAWWLIDHKTGALPTRTSLSSLEQPQLVLGAWLLQQGAFEGAFEAGGKKPQATILPSTLPQSCYWRFSGKHAGFHELAIDEKVWAKKDPKNDEAKTFETAQGFAEACFARYKALLQHFDRAETPYPARSLSQPRAKYDPYRHLARRRAWSLDGSLDVD